MSRKPTTQERLSKAETEFKQARARLLDAKAIHKASQRRDKKKRDDRRKVLAGACVLSVAKADKQFAAQLLALLDTFLTRPDERAVFPELQKPNSQ